jgi:hypothetical protein
VRLPSLISRFERNTKSGDPFGVREMVQTGGSGSIRDDAWLLYGPLDAFKLGILRSKLPPRRRDCVWVLSDLVRPPDCQRPIRPDLSHPILALEVRDGELC